MKRKFEIIWSPAAFSDLEEIIVYIAESNPINAEKIFSRIKNTANQIHKFPNKGKVVPELKVFSITPYLQVVTNPWRIIYRIQENNVYVLAVIDSRRDLQEVLINRLIK